MNATTDLNGLRAEADDDLLVRYQELDDQAAFAELDRRYHRRLVAHLERKGGLLRANAEEIVQETFMEFHKNRKTYPRKTSVYSLLYKIVTDTSRDHLEYAEAEKRDHRKTVHLDSNLPGTFSPGTHTDQQHDPGCNRLEDPKANQEALKVKVKDLLATLPPEQAEAVRLTRIEGHTIESAGKLLGLKPKTVHKRAERGIKTLREQAPGDNND